MTVVAIMTAPRLQRLAARLEGTFWLSPAVAGGLGAVLVPLVIALDVGLPTASLPSPSNEAVSAVLSPLAASALTIATVAFSVIMVMLNLAAAGASPRALPELLEDPTVQSALAVFVGVLAFAIGAQFAVGLAMAGPGARLVLTLMAAAAAFLLLATFVAIMQHVSDLMKVGRVIERLHDTTTRALAVLLEDVEDRPAGPPQDDAAWPHMPEAPLYPTEPGYVLVIDLEALAAIAEAHGLRLAITARRGDFASAVRPLLRMDPSVADGKLHSALREAFDLGPDRDADTDPRHGLELLGEIGCRALSPAVNDPITAIVCLDRLGDLLAGPAALAPGGWPSGQHGDGRVRMLALGFTDLLATGLPLIARSGGGFLPVVGKVVEILTALADLADAAYRPALRALADETVARAQEQLLTEAERAQLDRLRLPAA